jgi:uncharacterized sulfatase
MKRREFLELSAAGAAVHLAGRLLRTVGKKAAKRAPNVVLIISDDQAWCDHGFMGHPAIRTPRLDRLAAQSLVFTRGYVPTALCRPSLATISTGLYPHQHRIVGNDPRGGMRNLEGRQEMIRRFEQLPSLAKLLGQAGYVSFQSGKWWEGHHRRGGFTDGMTHGDEKRGGRHGDAGLTIGRQGLQPIFDFLDRTCGKPFFLWYAPLLPHQPHNPPNRLLEGYTAPDRPGPIAKYYAMCQWLDETCGELLDGLEKRGLAGETLVAYLCDNGWVQPPGKSRSLEALRGKRTPYERGVRTPIVLRWPGRIAPRRDEQSLVSSIDLAPTILAACGLDPPVGLPGLNLLDAAAVGRRKAVFGADFTHDIVNLSDPWSGLRHRWCVEGRWKLIVPRAAAVPKDQVELYDVLADPHEQRDLAGEHAEHVRRLGKLIDEWWPPARPQRRARAGKAPDGGA